MPLEHEIYQPNSYLKKDVKNNNKNKGGFMKM